MSILVQHRVISKDAQEKLLTWLVRAEHTPCSLLELQP